MTPSLFFRQLHTPIDDKGAALAGQIAALNAGEQPADTFTTNPEDFALISGSTFAYWVSDAVRQLFVKLSPVESEGRAVRVGDHPGSHDRYVRLFWEVPASKRSEIRQWVPYQKGGVYSPYYADIHLVVDWDFDRETYYDFYGRPGRSSEHPSNYQFFFRPGLTWPRRTQKGLNLRAMPAGCIFADKGPVIFVSEDDTDYLLASLAITNSFLFKKLVELQMAFGSYEVGVIQRTPIPDLTPHALRLAALAGEAHDLTRDSDRADETTHAFSLPGLVPHRAGSLLEASLALEAKAQAAQNRLTEIRAKIDELALELYGLDHEQLAINNERAENGQAENEAAGEEDEVTPPEDLPARVQNLLMWCVGVAFGRWDVRMALEPSLLPELQGPFDPLSRCAPGALLGLDGLPATQESIAGEAWLRARQNVLDQPTIHQSPLSTYGYPLEIAWDGILVDDPTHPCDIVRRARQILQLLWPNRADAIEQEVCHILGISTLRDYFRDPRQGFFAFHIKRYSKSRRKAPIYWLLQSERRNYALWLYYHRLTPTSLFEAGRNYADAKVKLEQARLEELRQGLDALDGSARRRREREVERQQRLVAEVTAFRDRLDAIALANLPPDANDGVLISIAPLRELVPWKEAEKTWQRLVAGQYEWSTMAQQMRERGWVKK